MIQKNSILKPADSTGVLKTKVFHVYRGSNNIGRIGDFLKISVRETTPDNLIKKKSKHKSILIRTVFKNVKKCGSYISFKENALILLKKRLSPRSKTLKGPISTNIRRKKFLSSFSKKI
jgi:large subunit ribosomal protein L14